MNCCQATKNENSMLLKVFIHLPFIDTNSGDLDALHYHLSQTHNKHSYKSKQQILYTYVHVQLDELLLRVAVAG